MYFKNDKHQSAFDSLKAKAGIGKDCEYDSALYALAAIGKNVDKYVREGGGINFSYLFEDAAPWSSSERSLCKLAAVLFNADAWEYTLDDIFYALDEDNTRVALQALEIRYW